MTRQGGGASRRAPNAPGAGGRPPRPVFVSVETATAPRVPFPIADPVPTRPPRERSRAEHPHPVKMDKHGNYVRPGRARARTLLAGRPIASNAPLRTSGKKSPLSRTALPSRRSPAPHERTPTPPSPRPARRSSSPRVRVSPKAPRRRSPPRLPPRRAAAPARRPLAAPRAKKRRRRRPRSSRLGPWRHAVRRQIASPAPGALVRASSRATAPFAVDDAENADGSSEVFARRDTHPYATSTEEDRRRGAAVGARNTLPASARTRSVSVPVFWWRASASRSTSFCARWAGRARPGGKGDERVPHDARRRGDAGRARGRPPVPRSV